MGSVLNVFQAQVETQDVDEHATMTPRALWHVITEALWATQSKLGADQTSLKRKGITGGATVFQLQHRRPIPRGHPVVRQHFYGWAERQQYPHDA